MKILSPKITLKPFTTVDIRHLMEREGEIP
jgi:hypothetical protein